LDKSKSAAPSFETDPGDRRDPGALRLSAHSCVAPAQLQALLAIKPTDALDRNKSPKRRVKAKLRENRSPATGANQVWAMIKAISALPGRAVRMLPASGAWADHSSP
jgi:hypothetical protein